MQICATLVCNTKNSDEQTIICVNYVLSKTEHGGLVMASEQVDQPPATVKKDSEEDSIRNSSPASLKGNRKRGRKSGEEELGQGDVKRMMLEGGAGR